MKKDVIYIDIEDDITAIIGKVKDASSKIVALVPPKRIGVLQSAVNLKLLQKSASSSDKRIVLITSDHSLNALAAGLKIPVAKNLQSRPEVPELEAPKVADEEVINGEDIPVGEFAAAAGEEPPSAKPFASAAPSVADDLSSQVDLRDLDRSDTTPKKPIDKAKSKAKGALSGLKVPNFNAFRKKFFLIGGGAMLLIIFLIWALIFAPHATVTITAKTTSVNVDQTLSLDPNLQNTSAGDLKFKVNAKQSKKSASADFTATGSKDIGNKAGGTVNLTNSFDSDSKTIPSGTTFTAASGQKFVSTANATIPGAHVAGGAVVPGQASVAVQAVDIGPDFNVPAQSYSVSGYDSVGASGSAMSGGDKQTVTVVSQADVDKAKGQLAGQDANAVQKDLAKQFSGDYQVINESFTTDQGNPSVSPAVGEQAKQGKVTVETTYTLLGLARKDVNDLLNSALKSAVDSKPDQGIYSNGSNTVHFGSFQKFDNGTYSARLTTTGYIGSKVDTEALAKEVAGKRYGEIQDIVNSKIPNTSNVDIKFSPFWVNGAPSDPKKVDIKFSISNADK